MVSLLEFQGHDPLATSIQGHVPCKMAFSGRLQDYDSLLAVGYRSHPVIIWDPMELQPLRECGTLNPNGINDMVFNPNYDIPVLVVSNAHGSLEVFGYTTMKLDSSTPNLFANCLSCSKDGRSLVCGTSDGTIYVYKYDQGCTGNIVLTPIYRINSVEEAIKGVAFHFDGLRFVDVTRRQCRVWEPAALVRRDNEA